MKKWGIIFTFIFVIVLSKDLFFSPDVKIKEIGINLSSSDAHEVEMLEVLTEQIYQGNLLLVNREYPVKETSKVTDVINLYSDHELNQNYSLLDSEIYLSEQIANRFSEMIDAAKKEGIDNFSINSGYRNFATQNKLYENMGPDLSLPAGHSEHNLGLALDVGSTEIKMADAPEGKWIDDHAWKYGFILRYPIHKTDITGIQYEPWHIRYVGLPHSAIMKEKDFVLEEYLDYLIKEERIEATFQGEHYIISYYPISKNGFIEISRNSNYEISGNNMDGIILTIKE